MRAHIEVHGRYPRHARQCAIRVNTPHVVEDGVHLRLDDPENDEAWFDVRIPVDVVHNWAAQLIMHYARERGLYTEQEFEARMEELQAV